MEANDICRFAYEMLISTQDRFGEFGKNCMDIVRNEDQLRHPNSNGTINTNKPNSSATLISALGIGCYKGAEDGAVIRACQWFTESNYISNGWFRQKIHVVDANPFGQSIPLESEITDIRHTATALLATLCFEGPVAFILDSLRNLLSDDCRDETNKGWKANLGIKNAPADFYATIYMLSSLYFLKFTQTYKAYGLNKLYLNQLLNNGLYAICSKPPHELGYNPSLEQTLRANGTILFFLAPLLADIYPDYLEESVNFIISHAERNNDIVFWLEGDFDATVNILAGLFMAEKYIKKNNVTPVIKGAKYFIENYFNPLSSFHPVSLGFILIIYSDRSTYYPIPAEKNAFTNIRNEDECIVDILLMVSTEEEERAITNNEDFEQKELANKITYLFKCERGLNLALARGYEYGELDAAIMTQTLYMNLKPKVIAMAGFCAGKRGKQTLGDVVIAEKVFNYDQGKQIAKDQVQPQLSSYKLDVRLKQKIQRYGNSWRSSIKLNPPKDFELQCFEFLQELSKHPHGVNPKEFYSKSKYPNWKDIVQFFVKKHYIRKINDGEQIILSEKGTRYLNDLFLLFPEGVIPQVPSTMLGVLATGTKVQQWDGIFNYLNSQFDRQCNVLDMEGHAMGKIAEFNKCPFIIAKGVGDFAQNGKSFDNRFINYAVYSSYRFLVEFLCDNYADL